MLRKVSKEFSRNERDETMGKELKEQFLPLLEIHTLHKNQWNSTPAWNLKLTRGEKNIFSPV